MRRFTTALPALLVLLACGAVYLTVGPVADRIQASETQGRIVMARQVIDDDAVLERIDRAVTAIAESVRPSVVHLDVENRNGRRRTRSNGSGWVYDTSGHIVTNAHVVRGATRVRVEFASGRVESGDVVAVDPYTDIAVVKIAPDLALFPLPLSEDGAVTQGQRAFAFGSPFGFKFSMSEGIVSGIGRVPGASASFGGFTNFIQTDAAVNPGNSGGPLVDVRGELIGMNVAIATGRESEGTTEGDSAGISFAIPLETVRNVVPQLIGSGRVARGFLGLSFAGSGTYRETTGIDAGRVVSGIRVAEVVEDGPSDRAGLRAGDLITHLRGQAVPEFEVLRAIVGSTAAGEALPVRVVRQGEVSEFTVTLGEMPQSLLAQQAANAIMLQLGMRFEGGEDGPVVSMVWPDFPADALGFERGDEIISVGGRGVDAVIDVFIGFNEGDLLAGEPVEVVVRPESNRSRTRTIEVQLDF